MDKNTEHKLVYFNKADTSDEGPTYTEVIFTGAFNDALEHIKSLAFNAKFLMGQVLAKDGKVQATIAPQGSIHISRD